MFNVTIKNLRGHARRMISTCLAVFLGVSFLCGTVILGNTITKTFKDLIGNVYSGTDAYVRSATSIKAGEGGSGFSDRARPRLPDTLIATVRGVPGVGAAEGSVNGTAIIEDKDGNALGSGGRGAPSLGGNWQNTPDLNTFQLAEGGPPTKPDDVVIDRSSAKTAKFNVGDPVTIEVQQGPRQFHISGIAKFGNQDSPGGATYALFTLPTAQAVIAQPGKVDAVVATAAAGVSQAELQSRIQKVMPGGVEVLTGTQITKENQDSFQKRISGFGTVLSAFARIALIVAGLVIFTTFGILFAQRAREMALLGAVGGPRRQVLVSVLGE